MFVLMFLGVSMVVQEMKRPDSVGKTNNKSFVMKRKAEVKSTNLYCSSTQLYKYGIGELHFPTPKNIKALF